MILVIVESPTKAKTISKFLGKGYFVKSSNGHIRDLPKRSLGVDPKNNFEPKYTILPKAKKTVKELKAFTKKSEVLILATDEDREGEAIAWHLIEGLKPTKKVQIKRIVFHEITQKAIKQALDNPRELDLNLVDAQQARRILDRLVGYKLSPFLWKKIAKGLSAGRVQSVAVKLIVDRHREIQKFNPQEYWSIEALFKKENQANQFEASLNKIDNKNLSKLAIKNKKDVSSIVDDLDQASYQITKVETKEVNKNPLPPFITSTLQRTAANRLGFSARQTMRIAQSLYEGIDLGPEGSVGLISYMRTDSLNLAKEAIEEAKIFIEKEYGSKYALKLPRFFKTKSKGAQEAHEAIRPTEANRSPEKIKAYLDKQQYKLYDLIWRRFIACQMPVAVLNSVGIDIEGQGKSKKYNFRATGSNIKFDGWLKVYPTQFQEKILPQLSQKEKIELVELKPDQHFTQPPPKYTEASLIKTLEKYGIGRPSTYAPIISTIQDRGYVLKDDQKRFDPSEIGEIVTDMLSQNFPEIIDIQFTARMEEDLDRIDEGKLEWQKVVKQFYEPFEKNLIKKQETVKVQKLEQETDKICPKCGKPIVIKQGRFGKFYACTGFPECRHTESINEDLGVKCPKCQKGDIVQRRSKKGRVFYGCSRYPECDFSLWNKPTGQKCPHCNSMMVYAKNNKAQCSNSECKYQPPQTDDQD